MKKQCEFITTSDYMLVAWSTQNNDLSKLGSIDALRKLCYSYSILTYVNKDIVCRN